MISGEEKSGKRDENANLWGPGWVRPGPLAIPRRKNTLKELFSRLVFNILCGNTDDHARNHAAFWDGKVLTRTPAYDICPQGRTGNEASQAMLIIGDNNLSQLKTCLKTAHNFLLSEEEARQAFGKLTAAIEQHWDAVCEDAELNEVDKKLLWRRQFLNPYSVEQ